MRIMEFFLSLLSTRKVKIKMKNSGTFRSEQGADAFLDLLSVVETTQKQNNSPYEVIRALF